MSLTLNTVAFTTFRTLPDLNTLASANNNATVKDTIALGRAFPKPVKDFRGVAKPSLKRVKTLTLDDGTKHDAIITLGGSLPVGASTADVLALLDDVYEALATQDIKDLFANLDINA